MLSFVLQAALLLFIAFLLGCIAGCLLAQRLGKNRLLLGQTPEDREPASRKSAKSQRKK